VSELYIRSVYFFTHTVHCIILHSIHQPTNTLNIIQ